MMSKPYKTVNRFKKGQIQTLIMRLFMNIKDSIVKVFPVCMAFKPFNIYWIRTGSKPDLKIMNSIVLQTIFYKY